MEIININNYKKYIGKKVEVEIYSDKNEIIHPKVNVLINMDFNYFYFYSKKDETYWHWSINDDINYSIDVFNDNEKVIIKI